MMPKNFIVLFSLFFLISCANLVVAEKEKLPLFFAQNLQEVNRSVKIKTSEYRAFLAKVELTSKGNGTIQLGNLLIRVYDQHDDGVLYKDKELDIYLQDLTRDGNRELILTGILTITDEEDSNHFAYLPFTEIISLDCKNEKFKVLFSQPDYSSVIFDDNEIRVKCS